jgi:SprT-like family protein
MGLAVVASITVLIMSSLDGERTLSRGTNGGASSVDSGSDAGPLENSTQSHHGKTAEQKKSVFKGVPDSGATDLRPSSPLGPASRTPDRAEARERTLFAKSEFKPGDPELLSLYEEINARHFAGALPSIPLHWEPELATIGALKAPGFVLQGVTNGDRILLNDALRTDERKARAVLCHEMVHVLLRSSRGTSHGVAFQRELRRLLDEGAFEGVPLSASERRETRMRLDEESVRLDAASANLEHVGSELDLAKLNVEDQVDILNLRISKANANGYGWPTDEEISQARISRDELNQRIAEFKARVARYGANVAAHNREVERYNLAMSYPDGLDEESLLPTRPVNGRSIGR